MIIRIIVHNTSQGLLQDANIFKYYMKKYLEDVKIYIVDGKSSIKKEYADINIFLEHISDEHAQFITLSKYNIFMINVEFFRWKHTPEQAKTKIDLFICKTKYAYDYMIDFIEKNNIDADAYYTKFTSFFPVLEDKDKDYNSFFHGAGKSHFKQTNVILKTWENNSDLDKIYIICFDSCIKKMNMNNNIKLDLEKIDNLVWYKEKIPLADLIKLKNKIVCHICPSLTEGYGHYINEGRILSSVILTVDAPPMNEFVDKSSGILIPYTKIKYRPNGVKMFIIDEKQLLNGIKKIQNMTIEQKIEMGQNARKKYEQDKQFFEEKISDLCTFLSVNF